MQLSLFNTLTKRQEAFTPINPNLVKMYVCGPTVYDHPHIGNARSVVVYDVLYRILQQIFGTDKILYVRNITDIDDKIIDKALALGIKISELTAKTTADFWANMSYLNCLAPTIEPKATDHVQDMIFIIERLIERNHAYISNSCVYFDVASAKDYTELSGRNIDDMLKGVRIDIDQAKKNPNDFVLWKTEIIEGSSFDSPWGKGRPGWHIECSAMSYKYLGEEFDIHGGGADLIFPHHTNEIAQSSCAFPGSKFAKFWVHNGFLTVAGEKMSKSLGNFITVDDLIKKNIAGDVIRLFLLTAHYRKPLDFNDKIINDSKKQLDYWYRALENVGQIDGAQSLSAEGLPEDFWLALLDDMNFPLALKIINDYAKASHLAQNLQDKRLAAVKMLKCANFIGLMNKSAQEWFHSTILDPSEIEMLIKRRQEAKIAKNWALADQIRQDLLDQNIILEDNVGGITTWKIKL